MDKRTHILYTPDIFQEALRRFGLQAEGARELDGFESFIYEVEKDGTPYIFRISHSLHLPPNRTQGEVDFLRYLSDQGMRVPQPQTSASGSLVEGIPVESPELPELGETYFSVVLFDKAPGRPPSKAEWNPELFTQMGRVMGLLHSLSKHYVPSRGEFRRHEWYEDQEDYAELYLPDSDQIVKEKFAALVEHLKGLPRDPNTYGLIHLDFHAGNFFIETTPDRLPVGQIASQFLSKYAITLFDFGDCAYAPFVYDIAMALFYAVPHHCDSPDDVAFARTFYESFLQGYAEEHRINHRWLREVPNFLKLREFDLYCLIHRSMDLEHLGPWEKSYMEGRKERLESERPFIDMEF